jgi:hypothetical protein
MRPANTATHATNCGVLHAEPCADSGASLAGGPKFLDLQNVGRREFRTAGPLAARPRLSEIEPTAHIYSVSNRVQVIGIDATSHATKVIKLKTARDGTLKALVRETMGKPSASRPVGTRTNMRPAVSVRQNRACPEMTACVAVNPYVLAKSLAVAN